MNINTYKKKMLDENIHPRIIKQFQRYLELIEKGEKGYIPEETLQPILPGDLPHHEDLKKYCAKGNSVIDKTIMIKLNGGLGTSMGLAGPKCLIPVKNKLSFLDITIKQALSIGKSSGFQLPLVLMNSFRTDKETMEIINTYPDILHLDIPIRFIHNKHPKVLKTTLQPAQFPDNPIQEWNPAGHGDIYLSLVTSGILSTLLEKGYKYAFVSNIDNLGATLNFDLLGYFAHHNFAIMMEAVTRTPMDKKGGHIARQLNNQIILRERAQTLDKDIKTFEDISYHKYFNSNNIWINLEQIHAVFDGKSLPPLLPLIANEKHLVSTDKSTPSIIQVETALGAAISLFDNSQAVIINRNRFRPVKNCNELFLLWSDIYTCNEQFEILPAHTIKNSDTLPIILLDNKYFSQYDNFVARFANGVPSLRKCASFSVSGDVYFGHDISVIGDISITNHQCTPVTIPSHTVLDRSINF